ncbi:MAG: DUF4214 domain-containing protein [Clostridiales bacterium]|nr:DUF4214 domain-containing protein [Clostridiales bacterium]
MKRNWLISLAALAVILPVGFFAEEKRVNADYNEDGTVTIDETNFSDCDFREHVSRYDLDSDGTLSDEEIKKVTKLNLFYENCHVKNLKGIEFFIELTSLTVSGISNLDVSNNTKLTYLDCSGSSLTSLDLSDNTNLTYLDCSCNKLTNLDVGENKKLQQLQCDNNKLTSLNVSGCTMLNQLRCYINKLTSLDVSDCAGLKELDCTYNQLTSLNVSGCTMLNQLRCYNNKLTSLDVSKNTTLVSLECWDNKLTSLDVSNNATLINIHCNDNQLTSLNICKDAQYESLICYNNKIESLDISSNENLVDLYNLGAKETERSLYDYPETSVLFINAYDRNRLCVDKLTEILALEDRFVANLDQKNFPDPVFREYVSDKFDLDKDGKLSKSEAANATDIRVEGMHISDLRGIEYFTRLYALYCSLTNITSLDVSKNLNMRDLYFAGSSITELDISKNTAIERVYGGVALQNLKLGKNTNLTELNVANSPLETLDVSGCPALIYLSCYECELKSLNVNGCSALKELDCRESKLTSLDLSGCTALQTVFCENNALTSLNLNGCKDLYEINCYGNKLTSFDLRECSELKKLYCSHNQITSLDLSKNKELGFLECEYNQLTSLDVSYCPGLYELDCSDNKLVSLDVSYCPGLYELDCSDNKLVSLDVSYCPGLYELDCSDNKLTSLNVNGLKRLDALVCMDNNLSVLDISSNDTIQSNVKEVGLEIENDYYCAYAEKIEECFVVKYITLCFDAFTKLIPEYVTPVPNPLEGPVADFVERLYTVAMNRASDKDGKKYWVKEINSGRKTGGECAHFFLIEAPEFMNRGLSTEDFVETLYMTFFDREAEAEGKAYWVSELKNNTKSREDVINGFIDSAEWCNICASYGVKPGAPNAKADKASANANSFATRLYTCCLNRDPEAGGLKYWGLALTNHEKSGYEAAQFFFTSDEFKNLKTSNEEYVTRLYTTFMDRDPETDGFNYWVGELKNGESRDDVLVSFAESEEFTNICKTYGIERGAV